MRRLMNRASLAPMLLSVLLLMLCGCSGCRGVRVVKAPAGARLSAKWISEYEVKVTNKGKVPAENVQVWVRYWQDYVPPHTLGYAQCEIPEGWYENVVVVPGVLQPGECRGIKPRRSARVLGEVLRLEEIPSKPAPSSR